MNEKVKEDLFRKDIRDLDVLLKEKKGPCLSIILKLFTESSTRRQNFEILRKAERKAVSALDRSAGSARTKKLMLEKLDRIAGSFDPNRPSQGIGIFISPGCEAGLRFPFPVEDLVLVADSFETRDVLYLKQYLQPYWVLSLTRQSVHLFRAQADSMIEVRDGNFPLHYVEEYEYMAPTRAHSYGNTLKGYEKDKSVLSQIRFNAMIHQADKHLGKYMQDSEQQIILAGNTKLIAEFETQAQANRYIVGKATGNFSLGRFPEFVSAAWAVCRKFREREMEEWIRKALDKPASLIASGIREVWEAASTGNAQLLLVDRDYRCTAYHVKGSDRIRLRPSKEAHALIADAVDDVIEKVLQKKGKVIFVPANRLNRFEGIALFLRWPRNSVQSTG